MHHNYKSYESKAPQSINLTHKCTEFESMYPCNYLELPSHNNTSIQNIRYCNLREPTGFST